jgi:hypothetical protein
MEQTNIASLSRIDAMDEAKSAAKKAFEVQNEGLDDVATAAESAALKESELSKEYQERLTAERADRTARLEAAKLDREMDDLKAINLDVRTELRAEEIELAAELAKEEAEIAEEAERVAEEIEKMVAELEKAARIRFSTGATSELKAIVAAAEAGEEHTTNLNNVMFESAVQSGVTGLAYIELARETGLYTDEQIRAAVRSQAMIQKAEDLGKAVADGAISVNDAIEALQDFSEELDRVPTTKQINIELNLPPIPDWLQRQISEELAAPGQDTPGGPPQGHAGLSGIVPGGFPNDSFPIMVESGERVLVQTKAQQAAGVDVYGNPVGGKGGGTKIMHSSEENIFYVPDQTTARFIAHQIDESRRQRYEDFMGRG